MAEPAETQAAHAEFLVELALMHLHPEPVAEPAAGSSPVETDKLQATAHMLEALADFYAARRG